MILRLSTLVVVTHIVLCQNPSPCPETFSYESRGNETDRWFGNVTLETTDELKGVWLHIYLDRPAKLLGNWFGETLSINSKEFVVQNLKYNLRVDHPVPVRFFVKYSSAESVPSVKTIKLNGKTICTAPNTTLSYEDYRKQNPSPCPEIFSYEPIGNETNRWYGNMSLRTAEDLTGIYLLIHLDSPAESFGSWIGEVSTTDNTEYFVRNSRYELKAGQPMPVRFFVNYNSTKTIPSVKTVRFNGKTICGRGEGEIVQPTLHISKVKPTPSRNSNENNRPSISGTGESRPSSSNNGDSRPSSLNNEDSRPSSLNKGDSRPSNNGNASPRRPSSNNYNTGSRSIEYMHNNLM